MKAQTIERIGLAAGPLAAAAIWLLLAPDPGRALTPAGVSALAVAAWMAVWWMTQAVALAATALLPLVALPLSGAFKLGAVAAPYASPIVFLFLGGFLLGLAMQRWGLHRRLALHTLVLVGGGPMQLVGGFMLATAGLSLWLSNTATTMLMVPIAMSVVSTLREQLARGMDAQAAHEPLPGALGPALMLGIAYAASIGGMGTLIGTPPNLIMSGFVRQHYGIELTMLGWMAVGLPVVAILLPLAWLWLTRVAFRLPVRGLPGGREPLRAALRALGSMTPAERRVAAVFALVATGWVLRPQLAALTGIEQLDDATIALIGALALFVLPAGEASGARLVDWDTAKALPWDVLILFGGGLSIAAALTASGADRYLATLLTGMAGVPLLAMLLALGFLVTFSGELTSNTAAATTLMPILAALCAATGLAPIPVFFTATLTGSLGFMLPVATPPNAIAYGTGLIPLAAMIRAGFGMNVIGIVVIVAWIYVAGA